MTLEIKEIFSGEEETKFFLSLLIEKSWMEKDLKVFKAKALDKIMYESVDCKIDMNTTTLLEAPIF